MISTKITILPFVFRIVIGLVALVALTLSFVFFLEFIREQSDFSIIGALAFFSLGFIFLGAGPFSIKTYTINNQKIVERTLGGLFNKEIKFSEIDKMKFNQTLIGFGKKVEQIVINLKNGSTLFIEDFDQKGFYDFRAEVEKFVEKDNRISPNYLTSFWKKAIIIIAIWISVMVAVLVL